ncbi:hypothetical protein BED47_00790 [Gottfriedia luciferensis]|uniref:Phage tail tape measure protein domain-containing protein n=1 Tax=Gottfriedia luciferensis TaxID=178774 RepID=A0ABX3A366_9BACI|nr:phage tail tape measure protein [Gottfriedia luciferensis]ODG93738.1 hypothetical protein BED47_00790 [Gottfriedia luciferensis]
MSEDVKGIDLALRMETKEFNKALKEVKGNLTESRKDFRLLDAELKNVEKSEEGLKDAIRRLDSVLENQKDTVKELERAYESQKNQLPANSKELKHLADTLRNAKIDMERTKTSVNRFNRELDDIKGSGGGAVDAVGEVADGIPVLGEAIGALGAGPAGAIAGIITGLGLLGKAAFDASQDMDKANRKMTNALGLTKDEGEKLGDTLADINLNGWSDSLEEGADAIISVKNNFKDINDTDLEKITTFAQAFGKTFGEDVNDVTKSASALMNDFGIDSETAFDKMANAAQNGGNRQQDLLDTINEYGGYFKESGYSADEFFNLLNAGLDAGALNADKVADAVKEFPIALNDGRVEKALGNFSKGTKDVFKEFENGKATSRDVMESIIKDIEATKDPEQKRQQLMSLGISQFEDLGIKGVEALNNTGQAAEDTKGKMQKIVSEGVTPFQKELNKAKGPINRDLQEIGNKASNIATNLLKAYNYTQNLAASSPKLRNALMTGLYVATPQWMKTALTVLNLLGTAPSNINYDTGNINTRIPQPGASTSGPRRNTGGSKNGNSINTRLPQPSSITVNNYSPKALNERESAKQTKRTLNNISRSWY